eukprot:CAMPEP_0172919836 /NCGR_PEP_ID=MMETSP1075-20121228/202899_1 /TAXON_ID=2916 /ORGANISM="Ceratium fusus, Strain PA161109" /LENGTH=135 /DNA_ID=CAMNT_0013779747 /DNA_START=1 /DNA_END=405 /DNA_ORIENTATION=-
MAADSGSPPSPIKSSRQVVSLQCLDGKQQLVENWPSQPKLQALQQREKQCSRHLELQWQESNGEQKAMPPLATEQIVTKHVQRRASCTDSFSSKLTGRSSTTAVNLEADLGNQLARNQGVAVLPAGTQQQPCDTW